MRNAMHRYGAILASALMFALYARVEQPWALVGWVALVPWLSVLDRMHGMAAALASGALMSVAFVLAVFPWFASAVARYTGVQPVFAFALLIAAAPLLQPQFLTFAACRHALARRGRGPAVTAVAAAGAWVGTEWLFPHLFQDTIGHGVYPFATLRQGADVFGAAGLTFIVLLVNESFSTAAHTLVASPRRALRALAPGAVLISTLALYGWMRIDQETGSELMQRPLNAALVQANLTDYDGLRSRLGTYEAAHRILEAHESLSRHVLNADSSQEPIELLIWPETVYPTTFGTPKSSDGAALDAQILRFSFDSQTPLLFGTYDRDGEREYNAAVLLQPGEDARAPFQVYRKRRLFPLSEEVPAWLEAAAVRRTWPWLGTWHAGDGTNLLDLRRRDGSQIRIAPLICLDAVDPDLALDAARSGAELIVTLSNDGWFAGTRGARLHLVVSAFRSIETRLPQLRATNSGISAVITATGEMLITSPVARAAVLAGSVDPGRGGATVMVRWGDWFGAAALAAALLLVVTTRRQPPSGD